MIKFIDGEERVKIIFIIFFRGLFFDIEHGDIKNENL